jgi:hypothetical protein
VQFVQKLEHPSGSLTADDIPPDVLAFRDALRQRFPHAGITRLEVRQPDGTLAGGAHRGGGQFGG